MNYLPLSEPTPGWFPAELVGSGSVPVSVGSPISEVEVSVLLIESVILVLDVAQL